MIFWIFVILSMLGIGNYSFLEKSTEKIVGLRTITNLTHKEENDG